MVVFLPPNPCYSSIKIGLRILNSIGSDKCLKSLGKTLSFEIDL